MDHLNEGFRVIQDLSDKMNLNKRMADTAKQIYLKVEEGKAERTITLPKGPKALLCLIGSCMYIAGKHHPGAGRSMKEIAAVLGLGKMELANVWKAVWGFVKADMHLGNGFIDRPSDRHTENSAAIELARRYCDVLSLPLKIQECAAECIERCGFVENGAIIDGRSPVSIAGGAIWFACLLHNDKTTPKEIMEIAQVSESTIRT
jgi:transcription initiation factor TFIIB